MDRPPLIVPHTDIWKKERLSVDPEANYFPVAATKSTRRFLIYCSALAIFSHYVMRPPFWNRV